MRIGLRRGVTALSSITLLTFASLALADSTGTLFPTADGFYTQFTPSTGSTHYTLVDESSCNGNTDYNSTTVTGNRDSYTVSLSGIPDGAQITQISITPCASKNSNNGGSTVMNVFYRLNGVNSADAGSYSLGNTPPTVLSTTNFSGLTTYKGSSTTLQAGAVLTSGSRGVRLSQLATAITYTPLNAPSDLGASFNGTHVDLSWTDNSTIETGFKVERSIGFGFVQIMTLPANTTSWTDTGSTINKEYQYRVRAYDPTANSAYSNTASLHTYTSVPADPTSLTATLSGSTQIVLGWTDNASNEKNYQIERKSLTNPTYVLIQTLGVGATSYRDSGLASDTYTYQVRATNPFGNSGYSNEASETVP